MFSSLALLVFLFLGPVVAIGYGARKYNRSSGHAFGRWVTATAYAVGVFMLAFVAYAVSVMSLARVADRALARSNFDRYAASNALFAAFKQAEPLRYEAMREQLLTKADTMGQSELIALAANMALEVLLPMQSKYTLHADDASILAMVDSTISTRRAALELQEPRICVLEMAGRESAAAQRMLERRDEPLLKQASSEAQQAIARIVESGTGFPVRPIATDDEIRQMLLPLYSTKPELMQILQVDLSRLEIDQLEQISAERANAICRAGIEVLEYIGTQPPAQAAALWRAQATAVNRAQTTAN